MLQEPQCSLRRCKHFQGVLIPKNQQTSTQEERPYCSAYPTGIPAEIAYGKNLHLTPHKGDRNIQYERTEYPTANFTLLDLPLPTEEPPTANQRPLGPLPTLLHKRLYASLGRYRVYLVNGHSLRNFNKDLENFNDWASYLWFPKYIPRNEIWIESTLNEKDRRISISTALRQLTLVAQGLDKDSAYDQALRYSKTLYHRTQHVPPTTPQHLHVQGPLVLPIGVVVWLVNGDIVREHYKTDFVLGGNGEAYSWIPNHEIWIEQDVVDSERIYIVLHELVEWYLMSQNGFGYDSAHDVAESIEYRFRHAPKRPTTNQMTGQWIKGLIETELV